MDIRGILFDKDGTLFDYHQTWMPLNHQAAMVAARGDQSLANTLLVNGGWDAGTDRVASGSLLAACTNHEIAESWADQIGGWDVEDLAHIISSHFNEGGVDSAVPVTDLAPLLASLRDEGYKLGVATSDSERGAMGMLGRFGVVDHLDFISGYDSGHGPKPTPGMVYAFCETCGIKPVDAIMVGDNWHDVETGRNAGVAFTVGVLTGTSTREELEGVADHVLDSIDELGALLSSLR
jgi:phosphoglycolate phosphatase